VIFSDFLFENNRTFARGIDSHAFPGRDQSS
jgi:hypothetical protein